MAITTYPRFARVGPGRFRVCLDLKEFFFADVVFAAVPVAIENSRRFGRRLWEGEVAGNMAPAPLSNWNFSRM